MTPVSRPCAALVVALCGCSVVIGWARLGPGTARAHATLSALRDAPALPSGGLEGRIAFLRVAPATPQRERYDLYVCSLDGSSARCIAEGPMDAAAGPGWAPGGGRLVFGREDSDPPPRGHGGSGLWLLDADRGGETRLTRDVVRLDRSSRVPRSFSPRWSPDGRHVAFVRSYGDGLEGLPQRVVIADSASGEEHEVPLSGTAGCPDRYVDTSEPSWAPEGSRLVFVEAGWLDGGDLWTTTSEAQRPKLLVYGPGQGERVPFPPDPGTRAPGGVGCPAWSPDGTRIAYCQARPDGSEGLCITDAQGGAPERVRSWPDIAAGEVAWSPDARRIAVALHGSDARCEVVDVGTGDAVSVPGDVDSLSWSPDSRCLVFHKTDPPDGSYPRPDLYNSVICRVNADGTGLLQLTPEGERDTCPAWEPVGLREQAESQTHERREVTRGRTRTTRVRYGKSDGDTT